MPKLRTVADMAAAFQKSGGKIQVAEEPVGEKFPAPPVYQSETPYSKYEQAVVAIAHQLVDSVYGDTIFISWKAGISIEKAAEIAVMHSQRLGG